MYFANILRILILRKNYFKLTSCYVININSKILIYVYVIKLKVILTNVSQKYKRYN